MTKNCPGCGFVSTSEARYCRMCGTPLTHARQEYGAGGADVSPQAATMPLSDGRADTGEIAQHDTEQPVAAPTGRVAAEGTARDFWHGVEGRPGGPDGDDQLTIHVRPIDAARPRGHADSPPDPAEVTHYADETTRYADAAPRRPAPPNYPDAANYSDSAAPSAGGDARHADDERTRLAPRAQGPPRRTPSAGLAPGRPAAPSDATDIVAAGRPSSARAANPPAAARRTPEDRALRMWGGLAIFGVALVVLAATAAGLAWYFMRSLRQSPQSPAVVVSPPPPTAAPAGDARAQAAAKLAEAGQLIAAGRTDEAVARLREAAALDPADPEPHRRLARLLLESGARRTALEELRAVLRAAPSDAWALRELASAQLAEGMHRDAADTFRRLNEADEGARSDDRVQLSYADALRLSGRESDAKAVYQRLSSSRVAEVARSSRQRLAQLAREEEDAEGDDEDGESAAAAASPSPTATPARRDERPAASEESRTEAGRVEELFAGGRAPTPTPAPAPERLSPRDRYERGVRQWASNRSAAVSDFAAAAQAGNSDANYYLGLNLAEGRDPRALKRGELMAAITYFQRARRGRQHGSDARRYEEQLIREYDRRRAVGER